MIRISAVLASCALASGCVSIDEPYPEVWPRQVIAESNACPVIDGEYLNAGERFRLEQAVSLTYRLHNHAVRSDADTMILGNTASPLNPAADEFQSVKLQLVDEGLNVTALGADGNQQRFILKARKHCRDSTLQLKPAYGFGSIFVASAGERYSIALGRAEDGSLLVRQFAGDAAFFLYVPVFGLSESEWFLFPPVAPTPAHQPAPAQ